MMYWYMADQLRERMSRPFLLLLSVLCLSCVFIGVMWRDQMVLDVNFDPFKLSPIKMKGTPLQCIQFLCSQPQSQAICMQSSSPCVSSSPPRHFLGQQERKSWRAYLNNVWSHLSAIMFNPMWWGASFLLPCLCQGDQRCCLLLRLLLPLHPFSVGLRWVTLSIP